MILSRVQILILVFFITGVEFGQSIDVSKQNIEHIFRQNANGSLFDWKKKDWDEYTNEEHLNEYAVWIACNQDSAYYKNDTITLYNLHSYYQQISCSSFVDWIIRKKNTISVTESIPPMYSVRPEKKRKVTEDEDDVIIEIWAGDKLEESFKVIALSLIDKKSEGVTSSLYKIIVVRR